MLSGSTRIRTRHQPLSVLADRLADERQRLDTMSTGDLAVRASVRLSYDSLGDRARAAFRLLGHLGLPQFGSWILRPLLNLDACEAERTIDGLFDAQLVTLSSVDATGRPRYRMHDLLGLFAREASAHEDDAESRTAAVRRLVRRWIWLLDDASARSASGVLYVPHRRAAVEDVDQVLADDLLTDPQAWFDAEQECLVVAIDRTRAAGLPALATELASALLSSNFAARYQLKTFGQVQHDSLLAVRDDGDRDGEVSVLAGLGRLRYQQDRFAEAYDFYTRALNLLRGHDTGPTTAGVLIDYGYVCVEQGRFRKARRALDLAYAMAVDSEAIAHAARGLGWLLLACGQFDQAIRKLTEAASKHRRQGNIRGAALALRGLSLTHRARGDWARAAELAEATLALFETTGDKLLVAYGLQTVAKARIRLGRRTTVHDDLASTLDTCRAVGDRFGTALATRTIGEMHLANHELDAANAHLEDAGHQFADLGLDVYRARVLRDQATTHKARGVLDAATEAWNTALRIFRSHGAREYRELSTLGT